MIAHTLEQWYPGEASISNFDHMVLPGTETVLRCNPNKYWVEYTALNFYAKVHYDEPTDEFVVEVMQFRDHVDTIRVKNIDDIIPTVSDKYGWE